MVWITNLEDMHSYGDEIEPVTEAHPPEPIDESEDIYYDNHG
jgi:hypothetical protein